MGWGAHHTTMTQDWDLNQSCLTQVSHSVMPGAVLEERAAHWEAEMQLPPSSSCIRLTPSESIILQSPMWKQEDSSNATSS